MDMSQRAGLGFEDRPRFFAYAARAMRTLAIDRARERSAQKRGGGLDITSLDTQTAEDCAEPETLSHIAEALDELAVLDAPLVVDNFVALVRRGFFTNLTFHRVVPDFVIQGGDPRGDGEGGPGYTVRDELSERPYVRGTVGIALDWADTGGSQFFITHSPQPQLDARYTVIGRVIDGMTVVDQIQQNDVIRGIRVWDGQQMIGGE